VSRACAKSGERLIVSRHRVAVQNKRKNLVGEGFEDVLAQTVRRACKVPQDQVFTRSLLYEIPGFNRAKAGGKENKVDVAIVRPGEMERARRPGERIPDGIRGILQR